MLAGGRPVFIETDETHGGFLKFLRYQLERTITPHTKALILNSPCNPTGTSYTVDELRAIGRVCLKHNFVINSDDIYERLIYDNLQFKNIAQVVPELKPRVVIVNGVSKTYAMTGWRIGYTCGDRELIAAVIKAAIPIDFQRLFHCPESRGRGHLRLSGTGHRNMVCEFEKRRTYIVGRFERHARRFLLFVNGCILRISEFFSCLREALQE